MKANQSSATAFLVAESVLRISKNKQLNFLVQPKAEEILNRFVDSRSLSQKIILRSKQNPLFRPIFNAIENALIPGLRLHHQVRKVRLEEIARAAIAENFKQIVIFGAGFDTLALRLHEEFSDVNFIEVDYPATQSVKLKSLEKFESLGKNLHFISLDLTEKIYSKAVFENVAFQPNAKTLFVAEGLLMYLNEPDVREMFRAVRSNGNENNRFAFTFMEREGGRIGFRNSSKLVDYWLKRKGEPFLWGLDVNELEKFLAEEIFSLRSLDSAEDFRRRYLSSPQFDKIPLAEGELLCVADFKKNMPVYVNDVHSKLNETRVSEIIKPNSVEEIQTIAKKAVREGKYISIAGGFHAMGGQQFLSDGILLDMSAMNRVLNFDAANGLIEVESGIHWNELIECTTSQQTNAKRQFGIRQKQTGADNLSIGGAISANIHGRGLAMKPFIDDVESFKLVDANGDVLNCSRTENSELFRLVIGGYGIFGVVASVILRLSERRKLRREVKVERIENLIANVEKNIENDFLYGDFQFAINPESEDFLDKGVFSCYRIAPDDAPIADKRELSTDNWKELLYLAHTDKQRAFDVYSDFYLRTDGQIYFSDTHQLSIYPKDYHLELNQKMQSAHTASEMISELYVPREKLSDFLKIVAEDFRRDQTDLIYGTIRFIKKDTESFLAWAKQDYACIVFNLHIEHHETEIEKAACAFKKLIDRALNLDGSFYLTYHRWLEKRQILQAYPQMPEFLRLKLKYDPKEIFQSDWYQFQKQCLFD